MNRNKSFNYLIYLVLITGLLFRYIKALEQGQQTGFDSWNYHQLIYQISVDGNINWNLNFLSFWGFYPPYAEMGGIILRTIFLILGTS